MDGNNEVMYAMASKITFICQMDFNAFPVDVQVTRTFILVFLLLKVFPFCVSVINIPAAIFPPPPKELVLENLALLTSSFIPFVEMLKCVSSIAKGTTDLRFKFNVKHF